MTLAELKIEALHLMSATYEKLVLANIADYYDDTNLSPYLNRMNGSFNRALDRFLAEGYTIEKTVAVSTLTTTDDDITIKVLLTQIADYHSLIRVSFNDGNGYYRGSTDYNMEGDYLLLPFEDCGATDDGVYTIIYNSAMPYLTSTTLDTDTVVLPGEWLRMIPYYIKGELYEEDEPNIAAAAMNMFNQLMMRLPKKNTTHQKGIKVVFTMDDDRDV